MLTRQPGFAAPRRERRRRPGRGAGRSQGSWATEVFVIGASLTRPRRALTEVDLDFPAAADRHFPPLQRTTSPSSPGGGLSTPARRRPALTFVDYRAAAET